MIARALRILAFGIASAAVIDPAITLSGRTRPDIAIVAGAAHADSLLAERVAGELEDRFNVVSAEFSAAAATVFVGEHLRFDEQVTGPVFGVTPDRTDPSATITAVRAPARAPLDGRVAIAVDVRVLGGNGGKLQLALRAGGITVDRRTIDVGRADALQSATLELTPAAPGLIRYSVSALVGGAREPAVVDGLVEVREQRWKVLFYDARPSWQSTFVRRTLENDPRFLVTSRVLTTRALSRDAGQPPEDLADGAALAGFDVLVIGAPDALSERDVAGLESFLRAQAGTAVLLFDRRSAAPIDRLIATTLAGGVSPNPLTLRTVRPAAGSLRATDVIWPARLPAGAAALVRTPPGSDSSTHTVVWRTPAGAGQLIVSGALNAWQYRDAEFSAFWQTLIGQAAASAIPAIDVRLAQPLLRPGESTDVLITVRAAALALPVPGASVHADAAAALESDRTRESVRLWPESPGSFRGSARAPATPGPYRLVVTSGNARVEVPIVVAAAAQHAAPSRSDLLRAYVSAHNGRVLRASQLDDLSDLLARATSPERRRAERHPMRSFWWMFPFALALSAEWWLRRRAGAR